MSAEMTLLQMQVQGEINFAVENVNERFYGLAAGHFQEAARLCETMQALAKAEKAAKAAKKKSQLTIDI